MKFKVGDKVRYISRADHRILWLTGEEVWDVVWIKGLWQYLINWFWDRDWENFFCDIWWPVEWSGEHRRAFESELELVEPSEEEQPEFKEGELIEVSDDGIDRKQAVYVSTLPQYIEERYVTIQEPERDKAKKWGKVLFVEWEYARKIEKKHTIEVTDEQLQKIKEAVII